MENEEKTVKKARKVVEPEEIKPAETTLEASPEPSPAPEAPAKEKIETDVKAKLARKTASEENVFIPTNSGQLENEAKRVAQEKGFELNRGTSIGARLLARAQKANG